MPSHIEMAWIERENGDLNAAEQSLFRSLAAHPNNPVATGQLGRLYEQMGQRERAAVMYRRSLQADWFQPQVQARLAVLENRGGAIDAAEYATRGLNSGDPLPTTSPPALASPSYTQVPTLAASPLNDDPAHLVD